MCLTMVAVSASLAAVLVTPVVTCVPLTFLVSGGIWICYVGSAVSHISCSIVAFRSVMPPEMVPWPNCTCPVKTL
jgi:hypothetical protein